MSENTTLDSTNSALNSSDDQTDVDVSSGVGNNIKDLANSTHTTNSSERNNDLNTSVESLPSLQSTPNKHFTPSKYDDYSVDQLQEFAEIVSPKVSELLKEQALALDDLLDNGAWMDGINKNGGIYSDSDSESDGNDLLKEELDQVKNTNDSQHAEKEMDDKVEKRRYRKNGDKQPGNSDDDEDLDGMDEEWRRLNAAEMELRNELELATNGFASIMNSDNQYLSENDEEGSQSDVDTAYYNDTTRVNGGELDNGKIESATPDIHTTTSSNSQGVPTPNNVQSQELRRIKQKSSDQPTQHQHNNIRSNREMLNSRSQPQAPQHQLPQLSNHDDATSFVESPPPSKLKLKYSLGDHAVTLDVSRPAGDLYTRPLLSRNDLETLDLVTLPTWITRPGESEEESYQNPPTPVRSPNSSMVHFEKTSRGRENYMNRIVACTIEYIEPPKSKTLRKLFSGWNPGPGERRAEDNVSGRERGADDPQRVMAYTPPTNPSKDEDSSNDGHDDNDDHNFIDVDGVPYPTSSPTRKRQREPLPCRTVTIRVRPDVLCGSVMDALTATVERLGGSMTKRQGGHLRAVCPGAKKRVWAPGEWERETQKRQQQSVSSNVAVDGNGKGNSSLQRGASSGSATNEFVMVQDDNNDDENSVASGLASFLSLTSPIKRRSSRHRGPKYVSLPPYLVDAQLVTKKVGKECQRLLLIRLYRVQDVANIRSFDGEEEEVLEVPAPLGKEASGSDNINVESIRPDGKHIDTEAESERSLKSLREAAALVQRIKAVGADGFAIDLPPPMLDPMDDQAAMHRTQHQQSAGYAKSFSDLFTSPIKYFSGDSDVIHPTTSGDQDRSGYSTPTKRRQPTVMEMMTKELTRKYQSSPSVGIRSKSGLAAAKAKSHGIFPSLSKEDSPYVKASWMFVRECIEVMDKRCLTYSSLGTSPLFQFPALPTLDSHFISQIKAFCRESMIVSLVKTASELEIYAREFELSCNNLDQLLKPTFHMYRLDPPALPTPVPLTAYPLDFQAPEVVSPPWGTEVMAVLDSFAEDYDDISDNYDSEDRRVLACESPRRSWSHRKLSSFECAEDAVSRILLAFQRQNDVEQGARLGRKNMQVMDRLAKMQAHKRNCIGKLSDAYGSNLLATKAADEFHSYLRKCPNVKSHSGTFKSTSHQVPLLICNVMAGNATGTCYVTDSHILFVTQLVPILGGNRVALFSIVDVELTILPASKSMLSPLPASISLSVSASGKRSTREEVYNFIPSIGARRFAKFVEVVKDVSVEDPNTLKFSDRGGLIYMHEGSR